MPDPYEIETPLYTGATDHPKFTDEDRQKNEASARAAGYTIQYNDGRKPLPPSFLDVAKSFPKDLPADEYDKLRKRYFNEHVVPRLGSADNKDIAWERFKSNTERKSTLSETGAKILPYAQAWAGFTSAIVKPIASSSRNPEDKAIGDRVERASRYLDKVAQREGKSRIPYYAGEFIGSVAPLAATEGMSGAAIESAGLTEVLPRLAPYIKQGLAFGLFEAANAKEGDRLTAGARGFGEGVALEGALGVAGKAGRAIIAKFRKGGVSDKELDKIVTNVLTGTEDVPADLDESIAQGIQKDVVSSRMEGRPQFLKEDPTIKGVRVLLHDEQEGAHTVIVRPGEEQSAIKEILSITRKGGAVDGILHNPNALEQLQRFMRASADAGAGRYEGVKVIHTAEGQAPRIALEHELDSKSTVAVSESEVLTQEPHFGPPDEAAIKQSVAQLRDSEAYPLSKGARNQVERDVKTLWDENIPDQRKEVAADRLRQWDLKNLIPEEWQREPIIEAPTEVTGDDILKRANELGLSEAEVTRLEEITEREPSRSGRGRYEEPFDDRFQSSVIWGKTEPKVGERPFSVESPSPTEPVRGGPKTETRPGAAPREDFFAEAKRPEWTHTPEGVAKENELFQQAKRELPNGTWSDWNKRFHELKQEAIERELADEPQAMRNILIPESEQYVLEEGEEGPRRVMLGYTPRRYAVQATAAQMRALLPGAEAITAKPGYLNEILDRLGTKMVDEAYVPTVVYKKGVKRATVYHEGLHVDKFHTPGATEVLHAEGNKAADSIAKGLKESRAYKNLSEGAMREEAFTHAATAIRHGDAPALVELTRMDGTVGDVFEMVNQRAVGLYEKTLENVDSAQSRVLQRKMQDLILRTTDDRAWELMNKTADAMINWHFDPEAGVWKLRSAESLVEEVFADVPSLIDNLMKKSGEEWAPSSTLFAEARGVRGPIVPRGGAPVKNPASMDTPPDSKWSGWTAISGWIRPMGPWVADLHTRVNTALEKHGKNLPIFPRWKDVDEAYRAGDAWLQDNYAEAAGLLKGIDNKKQYAMFDVLATDPKYWDQVGKQLGLTKDEIAQVGKIDQWLGKLRDDTNLLVKNYLRDELPRLRGSNYNLERVYGMLKRTPSEMSTFERLITEGKLDPRARHIGSFMNTMLREGFSKKFTDKPLKALEKLVNQKAANGQYVLGNMRYPLQNYTRYMRGIPDVTGQVMNKAVGEFFGALGERAAQVNKYLPKFAQLPEKFEYPRAIINKLMVWSYASGLGLRASIPIRDAIQVYTTTLPVLGPTRFAKGLAAFASRGMRFADEQGALLKKTTIGELHGDIFHEIPIGASTDRITRLANKLLAPSRMGHNVGRAIGFYGEYDSALEAVRAYRAGRITLDELVKDHTSLWFNDKPVVDRIIGQIHDKGFSDQDIARNIALEFVDVTLWPYRRGAQPSVLRTGAGRILGQFGMWPLNYLDFLKRMAGKYAENPKGALQATALWAAANYSAVKAMNLIGADAGKWFWFSPAAVEMSPHAEFIKDLAGAPKDSPEGREARRRVLEYPLDFFPSGIEMKNIERAIESGEPMWDDNGLTESGLRVLGFAPLKDEPERDVEDEVLFQMGYKERRGVR